MITGAIAGFTFNFVKNVNSSYNSWQLQYNYFVNPPAFSSMSLQSGIFTINRNIIIGLVSSIITAAMGYGIRLILLNYLEYDVFTNLDNLIASLSYFCSLGAIRFVINESLKEYTFQMSYCGDPMAVCNNRAGSGSLPVGSNAAGYNSSMQAPNNSGIGSSSAGDASITNDRWKLEQRLLKVQNRLEYFEEQVEGANYDVDQVNRDKHKYLATGQAELWNSKHSEAMYVKKDCDTNLASEVRMKEILERKLENGDYSMSGTPAVTKRIFSDSLADGDTSTPTDTKRTSDK
jgi:hypothetical protein